VRTIVLLVSVVLAHLAAGCYRPTLRDCTVSCASEADCAGGQQCAGGWCVGTGVDACDPGEVLPDGSMATDRDAGADSMLAPDARDVCSQGCTAGTCIGGVCTIDCSVPGACPNDVICPINLPCHVICGDSSCGHKVNCTMALGCTVDCIGDLSCADEIQCPSDDTCDVTCSGAGSCKRRTKCANSCACDVTCSGAGSCAEASECPATLCRVGNACSSQPVGCNSCP
jgi:hypothetical protein